MCDSDMGGNTSVTIAESKMTTGKAQSFHCMYWDTRTGEGENRGGGAVVSQVSILSPSSSPPKLNNATSADYLLPTTC